MTVNKHVGSEFSYEEFLSDSSDDHPKYDSGLRPTPVPEEVTIGGKKIMMSGPPKKICDAGGIMIYVQVEMYEGLVDEVKAYFEDPGLIPEDKEPDEYWDNGIKTFNVAVQ